MIDLQSARATMVEAQVRPNQVNDGRVISAMRALPREAFAPAGVNAYADTDIPLGGGRFTPAPMLIARMAQLVLAAAPQRILVVGAAGGYGAALLAACGANVVALEEEQRLEVGGLAKFAPGVVRVAGPLAKGWAALAPYDAIMIEGAVPEIPVAFASQLATPGRIVAVLAKTSAAVGLGSVVLAEPGRDGFAVRPVFDCTARILPAFRPVPVFEF
jgi:protein-L-isoaspartate(D-aspartate) O-methyltransferase